MTESQPSGPPYHALAAVYDHVMAHVDYEAWADYAAHLLDLHAPEATDLLELGAGTGSLALELAPLGPYTILATDGAEPMVAEARRKLKEAGEGRVTAARLDFRALKDGLPPGRRFDAALLLYDGLNYLTEEEHVATLLSDIAGVVSPGGVFLLDQSTPANSLNNEAYFGDEGSGTTDQGVPFSYVRESAYDPQARLHTTRFALTHGRESAEEAHLQRAYTLAEVRALIGASPWTEAAAYDGFSLDPATEETERVHWVLRRDL